MKIKKGYYIVTNIYMFPYAFENNNNQILNLIGEHQTRKDAIWYTYLNGENYGMDKERFIKALNNGDVAYMGKRTFIYAELFLKDNQHE